MCPHFFRLCYFSPLSVTSHHLFLNLHCCALLKNVSLVLYVTLHQFSEFVLAFSSLYCIFLWLYVTFHHRLFRFTLFLITLMHTFLYLASLYITSHHSIVIPHPTHTFWYSFSLKLAFLHLCFIISSFLLVLIIIILYSLKPFNHFC